MTIEPRRILWPTDFSELSAKAGRYAAAFAKAFKADLHVIHVCAALTTSGVMYPLTPEIDFSVTQSDLLAAANRRLRDLVEREFKGETKVAFDARVGSAWQEICDYAANESIDLIIISTHGYTGLKHALIGSTAERVVRHAACPVLTVKSGERDFVAG